MRKMMVAGNWKMNGSIPSIQALLEGLMGDPYGAEVMVCPPAVFLDQVGRALKGSDIKLGAQNLDWHESGAYTGEISGSMLVEFGCEYSLVGHSERRAIFSETSESVAEKFVACQTVGMKPVLCLGETLEDRQQGRTNQVISSQLLPVLERAGTEAFSSAILAYEPVWAIGTGETASPAQAAEVHEFIRGLIAKRNVNISENIQILYGGSVTQENAAGLFEMQDIDGALVGGASLKPKAFRAICRAAESRL